MKVARYAAVLSVLLILSSELPGAESSLAGAT